MTDEEKRAYAKGYAAGKRCKKGCKKAAISAHALRARETAFWQRALIAAIPFALSQNSWTRGNAPINTLTDRMALAADAADTATRVAKSRSRT